MLWRVPALLGIVMAAWWFGVRPVLQERGWVTVDTRFALCGEREAGAGGCVIDGDTVILFEGEESRRIRLTGFDAPERDGACERERVLAERARSALHEWLGAGAFEWNGGDDPPRDRFGRELRRVRRVSEEGTEYLGDAMVARGLAVRGGRDAADADWCE
ncbi:hypothetical protein SAMN04515621_2336 [Erythrobacter sp. HL-111]|nr:MAG: micrococcal nuclease related protein [Erythrobacteraceae bacterium HL-111]SDS83841.1 hypothetical protein SAMN04515621_2336 [Erythrobacter sp. HL-111]